MDIDHFLFRLPMCLARHGLEQVTVFWYRLIINGFEQMIQCLSSLSTPLALRAFMTQLSPQYLVSFGDFVWNSLPHCMQIKERIGASSHCFFAFSRKNFLPFSVVNQACIFPEFFFIRKEYSSLNSNRWSRT